jgi:hypothetical protein
MYLDGSGTSSIKGKILNTKFRGNLCRLISRIGDHTLTFEFPSSTQLPQIGETIELSFDPQQAIQLLS